MDCSVGNLLLTAPVRSGNEAAPATCHGSPTAAAPLRADQPRAPPPLRGRIHYVSNKLTYGVPRSNRSNQSNMKHGELGHPGYACPGSLALAPRPWLALGLACW